MLLAAYGDDVKIRAKAMAAAGSDARMNGCSLPVVIVSGSGNQGMTASLPVIEYAKELGSPEKSFTGPGAFPQPAHHPSEIGNRQAFRLLRAVSAGCGSGAAIAYLYGGGYREISIPWSTHLPLSRDCLRRSQASCAAKIAFSVDAGILGYHMYREGQQFRAGDGIVSKRRGTDHPKCRTAGQGGHACGRPTGKFLDIMLTRC